MRRARDTRVKLVLDATEFIDALRSHGTNFFSGVPCSFLKAPMQVLANDDDYVGAVIETDALAMATGAYLAGKTPAVFCQNSGLGNLINPLSSLNDPFRIPVLLVIGWRAAPGIEDEPQHHLMGKTTRDMLKLMGVESLELPTDVAAMRACLNTAFSTMTETQKPVALLVKPDSFAPLVHPAENQIIPERSTTSTTDQCRHKPAMSRYDALRAIVAVIPEDAAVVATTGKCSRELFTLGHRPQNFYMVGSMGSAGAIGLGIALARPNKPIIVLDGDGAALMRLGTLTTIGRERPANLIHVILDNAAHDSTGGQPTGSESVDFAAIAAACGYKTATRCDDANTVRQIISDAVSESGPHMIHMRIAVGSLENLARPTVTPAEVAQRFMAFLSH